MSEITLNREYSLLENLYTLIFVMLPFPFMGMYKILPIGTITLWGLLGLLIFLLWYVENPVITFERTLLMFVSYVLVSSVFACVEFGFKSLGLTLRSYVGFALMVFNFYWLAPKVLNFRLAIKLYIYFTLVVSAALIVQVIVAKLGHPYVLVQPGVLLDPVNRVTTDMIITEQLQSCRFSSVFLEPAHFAQYTLTGLVLIVFVAKDLTWKFLKAFFVSVAIVATSSTQGLVMLFFVWGYYLMSKDSQSFWSVTKYLIFVVVGTVFIAFIVTSDEVLLISFLAKWNSISDGKMVEGTSMYLRTLCGWDVYFDFPFLMKLFGCGLGNLRDYIVTTEYGLWCYALNDDVLIGYMAGLPKIFCEFGIVGSFLYFVFLYRVVWWFRDTVIKAFALVWILFMISSASFNSTATLLPMVFAMMWSAEITGLGK